MRRCADCRTLIDASSPTGRCGHCGYLRHRDSRVRTGQADWQWVYNDPRWKRLRAQVIAEEPVCRCGCGRPTEVVDHVIPHRGDEQLAFDRRNLQGLAKVCHDRKTARERWQPPTDTTPTGAHLLVTMGPPATGKTAWCTTTSPAHQAHHLTTDPIRTQHVDPLQLLDQIEIAATQLLTASTSVMVDGCNTQPAHRWRWLELAASTGAEAHLHTFASDAALARNAARPLAEQLPAERMSSYFEQFERSLDEVTDEPWVTITHHVT